MARYPLRAIPTLPRSSPCGGSPSQHLLTSSRAGAAVDELHGHVERGLRCDLSRLPQAPGSRATAWWRHEVFRLILLPPRGSAAQAVSVDLRAALPWPPSA